MSLNFTIRKRFHGYSRNDKPILSSSIIVSPLRSGIPYDILDSNFIIVNLATVITSRVKYSKVIFSDRFYFTGGFSKENSIHLVKEITDRDDQYMFLAMLSAFITTMVSEESSIYDLTKLNEVYSFVYYELLDSYKPGHLLYETVNERFEKLMKEYKDENV